MLAVATLLTLAYGTKVEDAYDRRIAPGNLRTPPKVPALIHRNPWRRTGRTVSVIRHGIDWLRRLLLQGRLWSRVWLLPEPWPQPKSSLEVSPIRLPENPLHTLVSGGSRIHLATVLASAPGSSFGASRRPAAGRWFSQFTLLSVELSISVK